MLKKNSQKHKRKVDPKIYDDNFYLNRCLGSEEFKKNDGKKLHWRVLKMLSEFKIDKNDRVLDLGCGRGDISIFVAKKCKKVIGIDYSKSAIKIANRIRKTNSINIQKKTDFIEMDATKIMFRDNTFDKIIAIDIFEHLYPEELEITMKELKRVLKPDGRLFIHVGTNKYLYDFTYKYYTRPISSAFSYLDRIVRRKKYPPLPHDPRTQEEKEQHVNEPTYFYLKDLLKRHNFDGNIKGEIGYLKERKSTLPNIFNFFVTL